MALAGALSTRVVLFVTDEIVVPAGMFGPVKAMPATKPEVLLTETVLLPEMVVRLPSE